MANTMSDESKRGEHKDSGRKQDGDQEPTLAERWAKEKAGMKTQPHDFGTIIRMPMEMPK